MIGKLFFVGYTNIVLAAYPQSSVSGSLPHNLTKQDHPQSQKPQTNWLGSITFAMFATTVVATSVGIHAVLQLYDLGPEKPSDETHEPLPESFYGYLNQGRKNLWKDFKKEVKIPALINRGSRINRFLVERRYDLQQKLGDTSTYSPMTEVSPIKFGDIKAKFQPMQIKNFRVTYARESAITLQEFRRYLERENQQELIEFFNVFAHQFDSDTGVFDALDRLKLPAIYYKKDALRLSMYFADYYLQKYANPRSLVDIHLNFNLLNKLIRDSDMNMTEIEQELETLKARFERVEEIYDNQNFCDGEGSYQPNLASGMGSDVSCVNRLWYAYMNWEQPAVLEQIEDNSYHEDSLLDRLQQTLSRFQQEQPSD